jgi:hypothetical protein
MRVLTAILFLLLGAAAHASAAELPSWMAGTWTGTFDGVRMEEHWTTAEGGVMLAVHRDVSPKRKTGFEFLRIEQRGDSLVFIAQPGGQPPTEFPLKSQTEDRVVFENLQHDYPQRLIYWRDGAKLCARAEGATEGEQWCWSRALP